MEIKRGFIQTVLFKGGYGFVQPIDEEKGIFFYRKAVLKPTFEELKEGLQVTFIIINTPRGRKAIGITEDTRDLRDLRDTRDTKDRIEEDKVISPYSHISPIEGRN